MLTSEYFKSLSDLDKHLVVSGLELSGRGSPRGLICGVGVVDVPYPVKPRLGKFQMECPSYRCWVSMLKRTFSEYEHVRNPTYIGVTVCNDWLALSNYTKWWVENQVDGWHMDKDLLSDSKIYSPDTCLFVPPWLNAFTIGRGRDRGECPIGVSVVGKHFLARVSDGIGGRTCLGVFDDPEEAHLAWKKKKLEMAFDRKTEMDRIDIRIYPRVVEIIGRAM